MSGTPIAARRESFLEKINFSLRYGAAESFLGIMVITINLTIYSWTLMGEIIVGRDFNQLTNEFGELGEWLLFLTFIALPTHLVGIFFGLVDNKARMSLSTARWGPG